MENEIKVGEYCRTNTGEIFRYVDNNIFDKNILKDKFGARYYKEEIVKHSQNIIDLIEVGDYVNGKKVERINDYGDFKRADFNLDFDDCDAVYEEDIKTIVTKQMMKSISYKVK